MAGLATFLRSPYVVQPTLADGDVAVMGVPYDEGTTGRAGTREGPAALRSMSGQWAYREDAETFWDGEAGVSLLYQFWIHTEAIGRMGWFEKIFNTPSHHRVHHGRNPQYIDRNYGGVLILFDRWFGTFAEEREKVDYGIVRQVHSTNLIVLNFHEFVDMWRDVLRKGPLQARLRHLWMPPEWTRPEREPR